MILTRLYELATRPGETILDDPAFEAAPVPYVVVLGQDGEYLGVEERRGTITTPSKKKGAPPKTEPDKGVILSVPRAHGNTASQGFARYFADTLPRVLPVADDDKSKRSRATFWEQIERAAGETNDPALKAVAAFGKRVAEDAALAERVKADVEARAPDAGDRCTFAWHPDKDQPVLGGAAVREWYSALLTRIDAGKQEAGPVGLCQITGTVGPIPTSHPLKLQGVPGGMSVGVSLISFDKPAFQHYGLDGAENAGIGFRAADAYGRALVALVKGTVAGNKTTSLRVGGTLFLFWTREPAETGWMAAFESADTDHIRAEFASVETGKRSYADPAENDFYVLALSGNAARAVVRDYLERPLGQVKAAVRKWFDDLLIADTSKEYRGQPNDRFSMKLLTAATVKWRYTGDKVEVDWDSVSPETERALMRAALAGEPIPDALLGDCIHRLEVEGWRGFRPVRMALMKIMLLRRNVTMAKALNPDDDRPPYLCGRLLALFERIQYRALGEVNSNVVDKYYGAFSSDPFLVLDTLQRTARAHLRKMRTDARKKGAGVRLERELTELVNRVSALDGKGHSRPRFDRFDRAVFSFGYYHQKAEYIYPSGGVPGETDDNEGGTESESEA